jgi:HK97 family phage prohead protease
MAKKTYDFCGWATKTKIRCSDGREIGEHAFAHQNGETVPLVWEHNHVGMDAIIGYATLEDRDGGVYAYGSFNDTEKGRFAKTLVKHGDISAMSIYANQLSETNNANGNRLVEKGTIREVSLVMAGANPGARIESVMAQSDENIESGIKIFISDADAELKHSDGDYVIEKDDDSMLHSDDETETEIEDDDESNEDETIGDVYKTMTEKQQHAAAVVLETALEAQEEDHQKEITDLKKQIEELKKTQSKEVTHNMANNVFEQTTTNGKSVLSHSEFAQLAEIAKKDSEGFRHAFEEAANNAKSDDKNSLSHSVTNIGFLFPDYKDVKESPDVLAREMSWVGKVMNAVHRTPFAKVKSTYMDITGEKARALGYIKGNQKKEEVISALHRTTEPQTIYKLQKLDRDDKIDVTSFDVVAWLKVEMQWMIKEEIARAILIGDGREVDDQDKIKEDHIRPILTDNETYAVHTELLSTATPEDVIDTVRLKFKDYRGSGNPTAFMSPSEVSKYLNIKDKFGHYMYKTLTELATTMRVKDIVEVEVMENHTRRNSADDGNLIPAAIIVNLYDYNVGTNKGGELNFFDDFDLNYNKLEYLIEARMSGALIKPKSALVFEYNVKDDAAPANENIEG